MSHIPFLQQEHICTAVDATTRDELLRVAAQKINSVCADLSAQALFQALWEREELGSTALGSQVAIPHCKIEGLDQIRLFVFTSARGIDFGSPDGQSTSLFFVILSPPQRVSEHLQVLARIARLTRSDGFVSDALAASDPLRILRCIEQYWERLG